MDSRFRIVPIPMTAGLQSAVQTSITKPTKPRKTSVAISRKTIRCPLFQLISLTDILRINKTTHNNGPSCGLCQNHPQQLEKIRVRSVRIGIRRRLCTRQLSVRKPESRDGNNTLTNPIHLPNQNQRADANVLRRSSQVRKPNRTDRSAPQESAHHSESNGESSCCSESRELI